MPALPATYDRPEARQFWQLADGRIAYCGGDGQLWTWEPGIGQRTLCRSDEAVAFLLANGVELNQFERIILAAVQPAWGDKPIDRITERRGRGRPRKDEIREDAA